MERVSLTLAPHPNVSGFDGIGKHGRCSTLEWSFTPKDYFEDEVQVVRDDYVMVIKDGTVEARINPQIYDKDHKNA